jgi:uncharacterized protein YggT (Ycf19 family)
VAAIRARGRDEHRSPANDEDAVVPLHEDDAMTDYERQTVRETTAVDPATPEAAAAGAPATASTVRTSERAYAPAGPGGAATAVRIVTFAFGILQALLVLRIILLLLVANQGNDIVGLIMSVTDPFVEPFRGMFALDRVKDGGNVLDVAALVSLVAWTLIEMLVLAGARIFMRRPAEA